MARLVCGPTGRPRAFSRICACCERLLAQACDSRLDARGFWSMRLYEALFACVIGLTAGCSGAPSAVLAPPVDHDAEGSWGQDSHGVLTPGFSFVMALTE